MEGQRRLPGPQIVFLGNIIVYRNHKIYGGSPPLLLVMVAVHHTKTFGNGGLPPYSSLNLVESHHMVQIHHYLLCDCSCNGLPPSEGRLHFIYDGNPSFGLQHDYKTNKYTHLHTDISQLHTTVTAFEITSTGHISK